jgi:hypothetical protein
MFILVTFPDSSGLLYVSSRSALPNQAPSKAAAAAAAAVATAEAVAAAAAPAVYQALVLKPITRAAV